MQKIKSWDIWGVFISGLCVIHCLAIPLFILVFPSLGVSLLPTEDTTHAVLFAFILGVAGVAFISGYRLHGQRRPVIWLVAGLVFVSYATFFAHAQLGHIWEPVIAIVGSLFLIRAHYLNHKCGKCEHDHVKHHH